MKSRNILIFFCVGLTVVFSHSVAYSQSENSPKGRLKRAVKQDGWEIPGLSKSKPLGRERDQRYSLSKDRDSLEIFITGFQLPKKEIVAQISTFGVSENVEEVRVSIWNCAIMNIAKYEVGNNAFCYPVRAVGKSCSDEQTLSGKVRHCGSGGMFTFRYYDNDGDGKFETFTQGDYNPPNIPAWARAAK